MNENQMQLIRMPLLIILDLIMPMCPQPIATEP